MVSPQSRQDPAVFLPDNLQHLLRSHAPGHVFAITETDTRPYRNGREHEAAAHWLTPEEMKHLERYSFEKRRSEWLSGRICAKQAVLTLLNNDYGEEFQAHDIIIETRPSGRPYLRIDTEQAVGTDLDISISHSHDMAVSIAADGYCGVDVQHLNDTLFKVKPRYCTDQESAILDEIGVDELHQLGMLWVGKEAIRKSLTSIGLVGFLEIRLEGLNREQGYRVLNFSLDHPFSNVGTLSVVTHVHGPYALAVCTINRDRVDA
jgi:phosphopantetheinyl transferase